MGVIKRIKDLRLPADSFVVLGSANMEVKGIRRAHDLDIIVDSDVFENCSRHEWVHCRGTGKFEEPKEWLERPYVEMHRLILRFKNEPIDLNYLLRESWHVERIEGILFSSMAQILGMKIRFDRYDRPKDQSDILALQRWLSKGE